MNVIIGIILGIVIGSLVGIVSLKVITKINIIATNKDLKKIMDGEKENSFMLGGKKQLVNSFILKDEDTNKNKEIEIFKKWMKKSPDIYYILLSFCVFQ